MCLWEGGGLGAGAEQDQFPAALQKSLCHPLPVTARAATAGIALGLSTRSGPQGSTTCTSQGPQGSSAGQRAGPSSRQDSTPRCSCQGLLPCMEEQSLHPGPTLKPERESTRRGSDSHITRKLIFLPPSANKMLLPDSSQSLFLPSQSIAACCVSGAGLTDTGHCVAAKPKPCLGCIKVFIGDLTHLWNQQKPWVTLTN